MSPCTDHSKARPLANNTALPRIPLLKHTALPTALPSMMLLPAPTHPACRHSLAHQHARTRRRLKYVVRVLNLQEASALSTPCTHVR